MLSIEFDSGKGTVTVTVSVVVAVTAVTAVTAARRGFDCIYY